MKITAGSAGTAGTGALIAGMLHLPTILAIALTLAAAVSILDRR